MQDTIKFDFNHLVNMKNAPSSDILESSDVLIQKVHAGLNAKRSETTWRDLPFNQSEIIQDMKALGQRINDEFENFVVLGIGGSALGSRAMFTALKHIRYNELEREKRGGVRFYVADNVDPDGLTGLLDILDIKKTMFHVITKSGNTVETVAQFMLVSDLLHRALGGEYKNNLIVTTDKEKGNIKRIADDLGLKTYTVPDGVGGRFSVFCPVGLLSAAVLNIDIDALMRGAADMDALCSNEALLKNPAYMYALLSMAAMKNGININVMMPYADALKDTSEWFAQLWAESLGKKVDAAGKEVFTGQTPVRAMGVTDQHSQVQLYTEGPFDKMITFIEVKEFEHELVIPSPPDDFYDANYLAGQSFNKLIAAEQQATEYAITKSGKLNMKITLDSITAYSFAALLYFLEMATAAAGEILGIDAFDQPGVEEGKIATFALMGREGLEEKADALKEKTELDERLVMRF